MKNRNNVNFLKGNLLKKMDATDAKRVIIKAEELMGSLASDHSQGLLLGLIQSGKTVAIATSIAMAADNGYTCFIVLTSDNIWLYNQTVDRLKTDLPRLQVEEKGSWQQREMLMLNGLNSTEGKGLVLVTTKNTTVLLRLITILERLRSSGGGKLPKALIIDDEADQASLDTQKSRRAVRPEIGPGGVNSKVTAIRNIFKEHTYLQVTATPQALFLQETNDIYRPEFTILLEPGKGYIGGNTFFSLLEGTTENLIRRFDPSDLTRILDPANKFSDDHELVPQSLCTAICVFYVGATIKCLEQRQRGDDNTTYSFLCHISEKKKDHNRADEAISSYCSYLMNGLAASAHNQIRESVRADLRRAYDEVMKTFARHDNSEFTFEKVFNELKDFIFGTDIQTINSSAQQSRPSYSRRYNILIGGTKLSRGVTIEGLIVTYYGRRPKSPNMDTMLQHARMYGYRGDDLDVTRLYVTADVETRFRLINESEEALRDVIQSYPNKEYRGIRIGGSLKATRTNVLNPNNTGVYAAGKAYFPSKPMFSGTEVKRKTAELDRILDEIHPSNHGDGIEITIDKMIEILTQTSSHASGGGLWDDKRIITALTTLKNDKAFVNRAHLVVRRNRGIRPNKDGLVRAVLAGGTKGEQGLIKLANVSVPTLFMLRLKGEAPSNPNDPGWAGQPFWVPDVRFPDGTYALMFNFR